MTTIYKFDRSDPNGRVFGYREDEAEGIRQFAEFIGGPEGEAATICNHLNAYPALEAENAKLREALELALYSMSQFRTPMGTREKAVKIARELLKEKHGMA